MVASGTEAALVVVAVVAANEVLGIERKNTALCVQQLPSVLWAGSPVLSMILSLVINFLIDTTAPE